MDENRKLKNMINEDSAAPTSGNTKYLKNKVRKLLIKNHSIDISS
jgi:hypothetical protein